MLAKYSTYFAWFLYEDHKIHQFPRPFLVWCDFIWFHVSIFLIAIDTLRVYWNCAHWSFSLPYIPALPLSLLLLCLFICLHHASYTQLDKSYKSSILSLAIKSNFEIYFNECNFIMIECISKHWHTKLLCDRCQRQHHT